MARVNNQNPLMGFNIYTDKKSRTIYYSPVLKKAFQIRPGEFQRFRMFQARFITTLAVFLLLLILFSDWLKMSIGIPIALSLVCGGLFEYFWFKFLNSQPVYPHFDKSKLTSSYDVAISREDVKKVWLRVALMVIIGVLMVINAYQQHYSTGLLVACYAACIGLIAYAGFQLWQLSKAKIR